MNDPCPDVDVLLARLLDDEPAGRRAEGGRARIERHLDGCPDCHELVGEIVRQRTALRLLCRVPGLAGRQRRVWQALRRAARAALADQLYELAKACARRDERLSRWLCMEQEPRPWSAIRDDLVRLLHRWDGLMADPHEILPRPVRQAVEPPPPGASEALEAAARALHALAALEGRTRRQRALGLALARARRRRPALAVVE